MRSAASSPSTRARKPGLSAQTFWRNAACSAGSVSSVAWWKMNSTSESENDSGGIGCSGMAVYVRLHPIITFFLRKKGQLFFKDAQFPGRAPSTGGGVAESNRMKDSRVAPPHRGVSLTFR